MSNTSRSCFICPMCQFESPTMALSLSHLRLLHGNEPRFSVQCGIGGCAYTGQSFSALYSHIYRRHPDCGVIQKRSGNRDIVLEEDQEVGIESLTVAHHFDDDRLSGTLLVTFNQS